MIQLLQFPCISYLEEHGFDVAANIDPKLLIFGETYRGGLLLDRSQRDLYRKAIIVSNKHRSASNHNPDEACHTQKTLKFKQIMRMKEALNIENCHIPHNIIK